MFVRDQFGKLDPQGTVKTDFEVGYKSGAQAATSDLDEILAQENYGSSQVVDLRIDNIIDTAPDKASIMLRFTDIDAGQSEYSAPISFVTQGDSRDRVFVTSAQLEERIKKFSVSSFSRTLRMINWWPIYFMLFFVCFMMFMMIHDVIRPTRYFPEEKPDLIYEEQIDPLTKLEDA